MRIDNFFAELKRRNVYKVAITYAVVAWLLIQAASILLPTFDAPAWVMKAFVVFLALGFIISVMISWAFEATPGGLKRTEELPPEVAVKLPTWSPRKFATFVVVVAAIAAGLLAYRMVGTDRRAVRSADTAEGGRRSAASLPIPQKSIAVLPFENLSDDKGAAYFADGIQDEILTKLASIADLKVISRTSTAKYKSKPEDLRTVSQQLGVANVLEGSVQKAGDKVRVNVQLIDARTDSHLWAKTYDRDMKDVFAIQSEVAQEIADSLHAKLSPAEARTLATAPTNDSAAYDLFLKAEYFANQVFAYSARNPAETGRQAADLYEKAFAKDPTFALAYARLSLLKARLYWYGIDPSPQAIEAAESAAARALALQPELPEAHLAKGFVHYWGHRDYDAALAEFAKAQEALPNNANVLFAIAAVHRRQGKMSEAIRETERAAILDPRDSKLPRLIGETLVYLRRYAEAEAPFNRTLVLSPDDLETQVYQTTALQMRGELEAAGRVLAAIPADSDPQGSVSFMRCQAALSIHQPDAALAALAQAPAWLTNLWPSSRQPVTLLRAQALARKGEAGAAREAFQQAQQALEPLLKEPREQADAESFLAFVYAGLGQKSRALEAGRRATELLPPSKDVIVGGFYLAQLAMVEAQVGETQLALNHIEQLLAMPAGHVVSTASLRFDPAWDPLRSDPRFQKLCEVKQK